MTQKAFLMTCVSAFILFILFSATNVENFVTEVCSSYAESSVLSMAAMTDASSHEQHQLIRTIITPHRTRLITNKRYHQHHYPRRESTLITIRRDSKHVSTKKSTSLPRVFATNIQSITKPKHAELVQQSVDYDLMMITESWLKPHKLNAFGIPGYRLINIDRAGKRTGGGVCMYVRNGLSTTLVNSYTSSTMSAMWVALHQDDQPPIIYSCIYHPPGLNKSTCNESIDHIIRTVSGLTTRFPNAKFVMYGDFNDLDLTSVTDVLPFKQIVTFPTHKQKTLDLVLTDIEWYFDNPETTCLSAPPVGRSDHNSIILTSTMRSKPKYRTVKKRKITEKCKINITTDLANQSWNDVLSETDPDKKATIFHTIISSIVDKWCPLVSVRVPEGKQPITTPLIEKLRRAKLRAYQKKNPSWKYFGQILKLKLAEQQQKQSENNINNSTKGSRAWWQSVKSVTGEKRSDNSQPYQFIDNTWLNCDDFCDKLNNYYVNIAGDVEFSLPNLPSLTEQITTVGVWEVYDMLKKIDTKKSTHSDDYPSWVSRNNAELLAEPIADIINSILSTSIYPTIWKKAEVSPLPKTASPSTCKEFRPISLLYHLSKIAEKFINRELSKYVPSDPCQYAYTKNVGTTDALVKVITDISTTLDRKDVYAVQALYLDFSKAFDLMRPDILAEKMNTMNINPSLINLVVNFLSNRSQCVKFGGTSSSYLSTKLGVPQGTISGPALWKIYVSNLQPAISTLKYADDTTIYTTVPKSDIILRSQSGHDRSVTIRDNAMQTAAAAANQWSKDNYQRLNTGKTQYMIFTPQLNVNLEIPIKIDDQNIEQTQSAKLLGVTLDTHLKFASHVDMAIQKSRSAVHGLLTLKRHGVTNNMLSLFYQSRILSILSYASPAWYTFTPQYARDKLENHQSRCLRIIHPETKSYTERCRLTGISPIQDYLSAQCQKYASKVEADKHHRLHHLVPPLHSTLNRHSERLRDCRVKHAKTNLGSKSLFALYL